MYKCQVTKLFPDTRRLTPAELARVRGRRLTRFHQISTSFAAELSDIIEDGVYNEKFIVKLAKNIQTRFNITILKKVFCSVEHILVLYDVWGNFNIIPHKLKTLKGLWVSFEMENPRGK